jgi:hypothetical protein
LKKGSVTEGADSNKNYPFASIRGVRVKNRKKLYRQYGLNLKHDEKNGVQVKDY